ncbi:hypothetical protein ACT17_06415 [Mycolicibacterium conceptionense]|uniref:Integration host factor-like helix-two turn-helix domain-containing protein n=1 Tax=Mycolicibacterium conceptionense TaxID=451644 RepID=A0A0J8UH23_9MYCO|nr:integration host factor, actinobacterial type [Mycolicibacterium conceptionense]KMV19665.1 hypothetical protein ACT17_06415 [Mycolicibacterium conceptionense]
MALPTLTPEQRAEALEKAAAARKARAELKDKIKSGSLTFSGVFELAEKDAIVAKTKVSELLKSLPGVGKATVEKVMEDLGIADSRRIGGLGARQRDSLIETFGSKK